MDSEMFNKNDGIKQDDDLTPLFFHVALDYISRNGKNQLRTAMFHYNGLVIM